MFTASYKGWDGLENGELLRVAQADRFDVLRRHLAPVALSSIEWRLIKPYLPQIIAAIEAAPE